MDLTRFFSISLCSALLITACDSQPASSSPNAGATAVSESDQTTNKVSAEYICSHLLVKTDLVANNLSLTIDDKSYQLSQSPGSSSNKYSNQANDITFWLKDDSITLEINGQRYSDCEKVIIQRPGNSTSATKLPFIAMGNEPGWHTKVQHDQMMIQTAHGENTITLPSPQIQQTMSGYRYYSKSDSHSATIDAHQKLCYDSMTGRPFPAYVSLNLDGKTLQGCGGDPLDLLVGFEWVVEDIAKGGIIDSSRVTINFDREGRVFGISSCNNYSSSYEITGETLTLSPPLGTLKACSQALMTQERQFLELLAKVNRYDIDGYGALILSTDEGTTVTARQP